MTSVKVRVVCVSDTHNAAPGEGYTLPKGDVLIHAGDLTNQGSYRELQKAVDWIAKADYPAKIVIAGNHDLSLDNNYALKHENGWRVEAEDTEDCKKLFLSHPGITYLCHGEVNIPLPHKGVSLQVFGSPYSADRGRQNWAFQYDESTAQTLWQDIPENLDVLITHTPPAGFCDFSTHWKEGGCAALRAAVARVKPRLHICGHCHEGRGAVIVDWVNNELSKSWIDPGAGNKKQSLLDLTDRVMANAIGNGNQSSAIVNASITATSYNRGAKSFNKPIVVDLLLPITPDNIMSMNATLFCLPKANGKNFDASTHHNNEMFGSKPRMMHDGSRKKRPKISLPKVSFLDASLLAGFVLGQCRHVVIQEGMETITGEPLSKMLAKARDNSETARNRWTDWVQSLDGFSSPRSTWEGSSRTPIRVVSVGAADQFGKRSLVITTISTGQNNLVSMYTHE